MPSEDSGYTFDCSLVESGTKKVNLYYKKNTDGNYDVLIAGDKVIINDKGHAPLFARASTLTSVDLSYWRIKDRSNMSSFMSSTPNVTSFICDSWDVSNINKSSFLGGMLSGCSGLTKLDMSGWLLNNLPAGGLSGIFQGCTSLKDVDWFTIKGESVLKSLFQGSYIDSTQITTINTETWELSKVTNLDYMFNSCSPVKAINFSKHDLKNVTSFTSPFGGCRNLEVINMENTILYSHNDSLKFENMFADCSSLKTVKMFAFIGTTDFTDMLHNAFWGTQVTELDLNAWDVSEVTTLKWFIGTGDEDSKLEVLDLLSWDTSNVVGMFSAFYGNINLKTIYVGDKWNSSNFEKDTDSQTFNLDTKLVGGNGTTIANNPSASNPKYMNDDKTDCIYAVADGKDGKVGYLTYKQYVAPSFDDKKSTDSSEENSFAARLQAIMNKTKEIVVCTEEGDGICKVVYNDSKREYLIEEAKYKLK